MSNNNSVLENTGTRVEASQERREPTSLNEDFLAAIISQDFDHIESLFSPQVCFRALVPSGVREGNTAAEATAWLQHWFGEGQQLQVLQSASDMVFGRLYLSYRLRLSSPVLGRRVIEQHAYCDTQNGYISDMAILCSGFYRDPQDLDQESTAAKPRWPNLADQFYDAGAKSCTEGPLDDIAGLMRKMEPDQILEVHASDPAVSVDISAWCRLSRNEFMQQEDDHYLIRRK
jgi:TusA-related sulfurtransferase